MAVKVFSANRALHEGRVKATGVKVQWVAFGSALWQVFSKRSSKGAAVKTAEGLTASGQIKTASVRVVKADNNWYVVSRSPRREFQLTSSNIRKFVDF